MEKRASYEKVREGGERGKERGREKGRRKKGERLESSASYHKCRHSLCFGKNRNECVVEATRQKSQLERCFFVALRACALLI